MSLECLPEVIKDALTAIIRSEEFSTKCNISVRRVTQSSIGSAFAVEISDSAKRTLNLFIKCLHQTDDETFMCEGEIYFNNEVVFYSELLANFIRLDAFKTKQPFTSVPKCRSVGKVGVPFIIMDNLVTQGYKPLDIKEPMSYECMQVVLAQLARFHAFSFALKEQRPDVYLRATSQLKETVFRADMRPLFTHSIHDALKLAIQSLPADSVYVEKFAGFALNIFDAMSDLARGDDPDSIYYVITHGDLWPNNILCNFDKESHLPMDAAFVDFQGCRHASPVHDLMFLLLLSIDKRTRDEFREDLLRGYHAALCEKLQELGLDPVRIFPYSALQRQLIKQSRFALAMGLVGLPLLLNDGSILTPSANNTNESTTFANNALAEFVQNNSARKTMKCKNKMLEIIMDVIDQGFL